MTAQRMFLAHRGAEGDRGVGMLLVVGTMSVVMTLVLLAGAITDRALRGAQQEDAFATALTAAETGVNVALSRVQGAYDLNGTDYQTPHPSATAFDPTPDCADSVVTFPASAGASAAAESSWAKTELRKLIPKSGCLRSIAGSQYVFLKPSGRQVVYAMGAAPGFAAAGARMRTVKAEYLFAPYKPANAVLTGGNLEISSSTTITSATAAAAASASVHSNGNVSVGGGNPTVTGPVTMSGGGNLPSSNNFSAGSARGARQMLPTISARQVYTRNVSNYAGAWFDLCADGTARQGATTGPCTGPLIGDYGPTGALASGTFRNGWKFSTGTPPTWQVTGAFLDGVYYVSQGNVALGNGAGNPTVSRATIIAASVGTTCDKAGGNIDWDRVDINAPYVNNLFMLADQDLKTGSNFKAGSASGTTVISGLFAAGDQVEMQTSSTGAFGAVIAADECSPSSSLVASNIIKNPSVYFDPNGYTPFTDVVNTTLWLELVG